MTLSLKHKFASLKADGTDATLIRPTNWNEEHDLLMDADMVLGRATAGNGTAEEIPCTAFGRGLLGLTDWANLRAVLGGPNIGDVTASALPHASPPPNGWLDCYGQALDPAAYAELFAAIGTTYGDGGGGLFELPDLRGRVLVGNDQMGGVGAGRMTALSGGVEGMGDVGGDEEHQLTDAEAPAHVHDSSGLSSDAAGGHSHDYDRHVGTVEAGQGGTPISNLLQNTSQQPTSTEAAHTHPITGNTGSAGGDQPHNNVQPSISLRWIMFTGVFA